MRFFRLCGFSLQFMTALPIRKNFNVDERDFAFLCCFFPFTGMIVGIITASVYVVFDILGYSIAGAAAAVAAECIVTGGLHLDGAADTCDAFGARKSKERTLEILKDSRVGTYGVAAIVLMLVFKVCAIYALGGAVHTAWLLAAIPLAGKIPMAFCGVLGRYPREEGTGKSFIENIRGPHAFVCIAVCSALLVFFTGAMAAVSVPLLILTGFIMYNISTKKIGGVTGDILGACNEFGEILFLVILLMVRGVF